MIKFAQRNLKLFFRDKGNVIYSITGVLIIFGSYILFLRNLWLILYVDVNSINSLTDEWVMAGILAIISMTTTLGAFAIMVNDRGSEIFKDFYSTPFSRYQMAGGYVLCACLIGLFMSLIGLIFAIAFIRIVDGTMLSVTCILETLGLMSIISLSNTAFVLFVVSFFKNTTSYSSASGLIGTFVGFVAGVYMPIGLLMKPLPLIMQSTPISHAATILRYAMMKDTLQDSFKGMKLEELSEFEHVMGVKISYGNWEVKTWQSVCYLVVTSIIFIALAVRNFSKKKMK